MLARIIACVALVVVCASCYEDDGGAHQNALKAKSLAKKSFKEAGGVCADTVECADRAAGFEYAKRLQMTDPDDCLRKGNEDFVDGCQFYGYHFD